MKIKGNDGRVFEILVDGRSAEGKEVFDAFCAIASTLGYPHQAVVMRSDGSARAVTFAADEQLVDRIQALSEAAKTWVGSGGVGSGGFGS